MQTMKSDSKSKKSGKGAAAAVIVPVAVTPETQGQTSAETAATQDSGAEVQASVAPTVPVQQEEPLVQLLDLNKIVNSTYNPNPIVRPLYYYYNVKNKEQVSPLIQFILSSDGQDIIKKSGYIPVK